VPARKARPARLAELVIVAAMVVLGSGCGDSESTDPSEGGRPPASEEPRDQEIVSTIEALWASAGVDRDEVHTGGYGYTVGRNESDCPDLGRDDRWFGYRSSSVGPGVVDQPAIESSIVSFLEGEGYEVRTYRSTHPASEVRAFDAVRDDVRVYGYLSADGATDVNVQAGPCAPFFGDFDPELYQPEG
jgi:hypothetical protein